MLPAMLLLAYIVCFIQRQLPATLAQPIIRAFGLSDTDFGVLQGYGFGLFYALFALPAGWLVDRLPRVRLVACGLALAGATTIAMAWATTFAGFAAARLLMGAGQAFLVPAAYSLLGQVVSRRRTGLAVAGFAVGPFLGTGLSLLAGGALAQTTSWRVPFAAAGVPALLLAAALAGIAEPASTARDEADDHLRRQAWTVLRALWPAVLLVDTAMVLTAIAGHALFGWLALWLIRAHHASMALATGAFGTALLLGGPLGSLGCGWVSDSLLRKGLVRSRPPLLAFSALAAALAAALIFAAGNLWLALVLLPLLVVPLAAAQTMGSASLQDMTPQPLRGLQHGCAVCLINLIGLGLGPLIIGVASDQGGTNGRALGTALGISVPVLFVAAAIAALLAACAAARGQAGIAPARPSSTT